MTTWIPLSLICRCLLLLQSAAVSAATASEDRKAVYRQAVVENYGDSIPSQPCPCDPNPPNTTARQLVAFRDPTIPVWPFERLPLPEGTLERVLCRITCEKSSTGDMDMNQLVRALYFMKSETDRAEIINALQALYDAGELPFWLQPRETHRQYWTENHMIMNMASATLLTPLLDVTTYNYVGAESLRKRLIHWLDLKINYGFYEFLSTTYLKYTFAALLNLIDFEKDEEVQSKAQVVADRLVSELLLITTSAGYSYPVAGRNYDFKYVMPSWAGAIQWMALGIGLGMPFDEQTSWRNDYAGGFLATSTYDLEVPAATWTPVVDTVLSIGHDVVQHKEIHASLDNRVDQTLFQWSAGATFLPETVLDTEFVFDSYNLDTHDNFGFVAPVAAVLGQNIDDIARLVPGLSRGANIAGADISIYRHHGVALSSLYDFIVGARGYQQWSWVATIEDIAVYTQSGMTSKRFEDAETSQVSLISEASQIHMPDIKQDGNVALITYRPSKILFLPSSSLYIRNIIKMLDLGFDLDFPTQVALRFPIDRFDQVVDKGRWILGRKNESYIAVWRHGLRQNDCSPPEEPSLCDPYFYSNPKSFIRGQAWAVVVGNNMTHGSFEEFEDVILQGEVSGRTVFTPRLGIGWFTYKASLRVDGKSLSSRLDGRVRNPGRIKV
jgi:hypothetical protein